MIKKKQVLAVLSIVVASCLIGTMFSMNIEVMARDDDDDGSPWHRVWTAISGLETSVDNLNTTVIEQTAQISELQSRVAELETKLSILNATKLGTPDYDSGWTDFGLSQWGVINHGLNTTHLLWYGLREPGNYGTITLMRIINANAMEFYRTYQWDYHKVRILLWRISEPPT